LKERPLWVHSELTLKQLGLVIWIHFELATDQVQWCTLVLRLKRFL